MRSTPSSLGPLTCPAGHPPHSAHPATAGPPTAQEVADHGWRGQPLPISHHCLPRSGHTHPPECIAPWRQAQEEGSAPPSCLLGCVATSTSRPLMCVLAACHRVSSPEIPGLQGLIESRRPQVRGNTSFRLLQGSKRAPGMQDYVTGPIQHQSFTKLRPSSVPT